MIGTIKNVSKVNGFLKTQLVSVISLAPKNIGLTFRSNSSLSAFITEVSLLSMNHCAVMPG